MNNTERIIKKIYHSYRRTHSQKCTSCPDQEALACFLEGKSSKPEAEAMQEHIISCNNCSEITSLFYQKVKDKKQVPELMIEKVKALLGEGGATNVIEIILALKGKALQIIKTSCDIILENEIMPLPILRSRSISELFEEIILIKELENIKITIEFHKREEDKVRLMLRFIDKIGNKNVTDLRVALFKDNKELESYDAASAEVIFEKVSFGRYSVQISRKENKLGVINLEIK